MIKISQKQIEANRVNGKLGGVKTATGKAVTRYNAVKHGLLSEKTLFDNEDPSELLALEKQLRKELSPATEMELLLVDRITSNIWRLRRLLSIEDHSAMYVCGYDKKNISITKVADIFFRYETMLERGLFKALHELEKMKSARCSRQSLTSPAVDIEILADEKIGFVS